MIRLNRRRAVAGTVGAAAALATAIAGMPASAVGSSSATDSDSARATYHRLAAQKGSDNAKTVKLDLLAINDFHGNLEVPTGSSGRINNTTAGGAAYLARHLQLLRNQAAANGANTLTVAAGDLIGASPLISAAFHDEPTIEAMNQMGLDVASVGNHEFDEGYQELLRMQNGGCLPDGDGANNQNSCPDPSHPFPGASFQYLSANVFWDDGKPHPQPTLFPATKVVKVGGVKVGFIGMTLEGTPDIVTKSGVEGLRFADEVETANALVPKLQNQGVKAIVVLLHEGGVPVDATAYDACSGVSGAGMEIAKNLSPQIDVVISGHTHQPYNCTVTDPAGNPRLFTSASSFGRLVTDVHLLLNKSTSDVVRPAAFAQNKIVTNDASVTPDAGISALVDKYRTLVAPIANKVIGHLNGATSLSRTPDANGSGDSPLGNLIADAQKLDPTTVPDSGPAQGVVPQIAFMNPGGIRADLAAPGGEVTFGSAFTVQPFNNYDVSMDLTGQQILNLLEQQWTGGNVTPNRKILQVSGITYTWDDSKAGGPADPKVVPSSVMVDANRDGVANEPIDPAATYRIVCNSFLSDGGDGFGVFASGQNKFFGGLDIDALANYLTANDPYTPTATDRINKLP